MLYFGEKWDAPNTDNADRASTPVGAECDVCQRKIRMGDQGFLIPTPAHRGCLMATTTGHMFGICGCTGFEDTYEAGMEIIRRHDAGTLKMVQ